MAIRTILGELYQSQEYWQMWTYHVISLIGLSLFIALRYYHVSNSNRSFGQSPVLGILYLVLNTKDKQSRVSMTMNIC